jgi:peptide deformylase
MMQVLKFPNPRLRIKAQKILKITPEIKKTLDDMLKIMYKNKGVGLAATQVDVHLAMIVIDVSEQQNQPLKLINPVIIKSCDTQDEEEGCLSVPGFRAEIKRAQNITYTAIDENNTTIQQEVNGLMAVCIQHEIDHLNGKLFIDYLSNAKRQKVRTLIKKNQNNKNNKK